MRQIVLCIDWSNIAFRSLYMMGGYGSAPGSFDTKDECDRYIGKMATDIAYIVRSFMPSKVIFCTDSKHSWRKDVYEDYKANRERPDTFNWDNIFDALNRFKAHLESKGYLFAETEHAEADDLMALIKETVIDAGYPDLANMNVILVSADADIRQLITFNKDTHQYCAVFNEIGRGPGGFKHIYVTPEMLEWYNDTTTGNDIFFTGLDADRQYLKGILDSNLKIRIEAVDPESVLLTKIFCGDDGDNVPAFYDWYGSTGKKVRVTATKQKALLEALGVNTMAALEAVGPEELHSALETACKREIIDISAPERLERQKKLVELKSSNFPKSIRLYAADVLQMLQDGRYLQNVISLKMDDLIKGSDFEQTLKHGNARMAEVFQGLDKYIADNQIQVTKLL